MKFRTPCRPACTGQLSLDPEKPLLMLGSCFTLNIGSRLRSGLWDACVNPGGTLFNPASIARTLSLAIAENRDIAVDKNGVTWFSWDFPTTFSGPDYQSLLSQTDEALDCCADYLKKSQALIVTFGTAGIYELSSRPGRIVANCHKLPPATFTRRRMTTAEISDMWISLITDLRKVNPELKIIITVSPVRHLKDGFEENTRSKATLILAAEDICAKVKDCAYFPAYELLNDDLRDYRFYAEDMAHPSGQAADYIYEVFCDTFLTPDSRRVLEEGRALSRRIAHRPLAGGDTEAYRRFSEATSQLAADFRSRHPAMLKPDALT